MAQIHHQTCNCSAGILQEVRPSYCFYFLTGKKHPSESGTAGNPAETRHTDDAVENFTSPLIPSFSFPSLNAQRRTDGVN